MLISERSAGTGTEGGCCEGDSDVGGQRGQRGRARAMRVSEDEASGQQGQCGNVNNEEAGDRTRATG